MGDPAVKATQGCGSCAGNAAHASLTRCSRRELSKQARMCMENNTRNMAPMGDGHPAGEMALFRERCGGAQGVFLSKASQQQTCETVPPPEQGPKAEMRETGVSRCHPTSLPDSLSDGFRRNPEGFASPRGAVLHEPIFRPNGIPPPETTLSVCVEDTHSAVSHSPARCPHVVLNVVSSNNTSPGRRDGRCWQTCERAWATTHDTP